MPRKSIIGTLILVRWRVFKGRRMYNIQERVLQFAGKIVPIQRGLKTTHCQWWKNSPDNRMGDGEGQWAICNPGASSDDGNTSDKGLKDWIFDKELMKPLAGLITSEIKIREEMFATGKKEWGGHQGAFLEQTSVSIATVGNCLNDIVDDILRDCHHRPSKAMNDVYISQF